MLKKKHLLLKKFRVWQWAILASLGTCLAFMMVPAFNTSLAADRKSDASPADPFAVALDKEMPDWLSEYEVPGAVELGWEPGSSYHYSGGGYTVLQMVIEDVTGEPYTVYLKREILTPLGLTTGDWVWTRELSTKAPTPYGFRGGDVMEYRTFATLGIGNYATSVPDFARFVAMLMTGPNGESPGCGVLKPETMALMTTTQPNSGGYGLGYATVPLPDGTKLISHGGASDGWVSWFALAPEQRSGSCSRLPATWHSHFATVSMNCG